MAFNNEQVQELRDLVLNAQNSPKAIGYENIVVDGTIKKLTVPSGAMYAQFVFESTASGVSARYLNTSTLDVISTTLGFPLSTLDHFDISQPENLVNFRITQAQAGTHSLKVQYYRY